jgi:hypothetical protein
MTAAMLDGRIVSQAVVQGVLTARTVLHNLAQGAMAVGRLATAVPGGEKAAKLGCDALAPSPSLVHRPHPPTAHSTYGGMVPKPTVVTVCVNLSRRERWPARGGGDSH